MLRKDLIPILDFVKPALADQELIPIFQCIVFNGNEIYAYNDSLGIVVPSKDIGHFALNGNTLYGFIKAARGKEASFDIGDHEVLVKSGRSKLKLPYFKQDEFIFEEPENTENEWEFVTSISENLIEGLKICLTTSSQDFSLPALMGVTIRIFEDEGEIVLYSCNGDAISRYSLWHLSKDSKELSNQFTIPNAFCDALIRMSANMSFDESTLGINKDWVMAMFESGHRIWGRILSVDDPMDHQDSIDKAINEEPTYIAIPKGLSHALTRARVVADPEGKDTLITIKDKTLRLHTETPIGDVNDVFKLREDHPDVEATVNAAAMQRSLATCDQLSILENVTCYKNGEVLFQILGNT